MLSFLLPTLLGIRSKSTSSPLSSMPFRECFKEGGFATKEDEKEIGGNFLVGIQGRLFCIESDYQVEEAIDNYTAVKWL